jgi:2-oxoisovalerate dehydrogenase E2 component (dihydrolipoyl transacylase)
MSTFRLPDLAEGLSEAEIIKWHIKVGDHVEVDQPMVSVETAKAVVEVPAPYGGVIKALHAQAGDRVETGSPLVDFEPDQEAQLRVQADSGTVVGQMPAEGNTAPSRPRPTRSPTRRACAPCRPRARSRAASVSTCRVSAVADATAW